MALKTWSTTAGNNATVDSINWAENQAPSTVNDSARAMMADVRAWYNDIEWRDWGHTVTYASATTFTVATDVTSVYVANQPIRCTDATTLYGKVASSSYSAPNTTVTVTLDSGSLSASLTAVSVGQKPTGKPIDVSGVRGAVANTGNETIAGNKTFSGNTTLSGVNTLSGVTTMSAKSLWLAEGAAVASASSTNIWAGDGNTVHITGTATINDFATAPQAGAIMHCIADAAFTIADSATIVVPGNANRTVAADDTFDVYAETTTTFRIQNYIRADGKAVLDLTSSAVTATTSGTSHDITGIPSWVKKITVMLTGVSIDNTTGIILQLGDSGGIETTGYKGTGVTLADATAVSASISTTYLFIAQTTIATTAQQGIGTLALSDSSTNTWTWSGIFGRDDASNFSVVSGSKSLSATLDRVRLSTVTGTANFDAGKFSLMYE